MSAISKVSGTIALVVLLVCNCGYPMRISYGGLNVDTSVEGWKLQFEFEEFQRVGVPDSLSNFRLKYWLHPEDDRVSPEIRLDSAIVFHCLKDDTFGDRIWSDAFPDFDFTLTETLSTVTVGAFDPSPEKIFCEVHISLRDTTKATIETSVRVYKFWRVRLSQGWLQ